MRYNTEQAVEILQRVEQILQQDDPPPLKIRKLWLSLLALRARALNRDIRAVVGDRIRAGIFKGMQVTPEAIDGSYPCLLLGSYENELTDTIETIIACPYARILNIGCSAGYYAVGLARRMPHITVDAFDIDPEAQRKCAALAALNHVDDRIRIAGEFHGKDFAAYADGKTLAIIDIEGAEAQLLAPENWPALTQIDMLVEMHDNIVPHVSRLLTERFAATHDITVIRNRITLPPIDFLIPPGGYIDPFDHVLLGWEARDGPTPWGFFRARK